MVVGADFGSVHLPDSPKARSLKNEAEVARSEQGPVPIGMVRCSRSVTVGEQPPAGPLARVLLLVEPIPAVKVGVVLTTEFRVHQSFAYLEAIRDALLEPRDRLVRSSA